MRIARNRHRHPVHTIRHAAAALLLGTLALFAGAAEQPLRVGWVYAMANAPAVIAEQQGLFAAEGLKVELKSFGDGPLLQQAVAAGEIDIAYVGTPPVYQWFSRGLEGKILAKVNSGQAAVIVSAELPVQTVAELRGRKIASVARGSGMDVLLRGFVLKEVGKLDPDRDLTVVAMPPANMNAALDRHVTDAVFSWEPFVSESLLRGGSRLVLDVNKALPNYPWYVVMAVPKTLRDRPDDVVKLLRAHARAVDFLNDQPDAANRIIVDAFKIAPVHTLAGKTIAPEAVVKEARKRLGWSAKLEPSDLQFIQRLMDYSLALGFMARPIKVDQLVDQSWQRKATP
jgi:NitT/TauT family transport system substrate-binding protein